MARKAFLAGFLAFLFPFFGVGQEIKGFRAGAYALDVTPVDFPCIVNGGFLEATAKSAQDKLFARCLILENGKETIVFIVVDSCMMPREFLDDVKKLIEETYGIKSNKVLISATHTHTAPAVMACLGARADEKYRSFLKPQLVRVVGLALKTMQPAKAGWTVVQDPDHTYCRRWIFRSDKMLTSPFGDKDVRANMHPGHLNPTAIGPSGPVDQGLTLLSLQSKEGKPIALLANYSMHYYGTAAVSADYCGHFCQAIAKKITQDNAFVAIMSQGTSGDLMWMDYGSPAPKRDIQAYAETVASEAFKGFKKIEYQENVPLVMAETQVKLRRRIPDEKRLEWAKNIKAKMTGEVAKNRDEVYAMEQIYLHEKPEVELILQAIRVGDLGITAIPNEVFGITGLKIKERSPLKVICNIELANGAEGYIPPPEQHALGGYTTWPARTAALEVQAEPKIVENLLTLLEKISGGKRKPWYFEKVVSLDSKPAAFFRMEEMELGRAYDASGNNNHGEYEKGVALWLNGPEGNFFPSRANKSAHFAGGRLKFNIPNWSNNYTVAGWVWNGFPVKERPVTGYLFSRGKDKDKLVPGDHFGLGGTNSGQGKLLFFNGNKANQVITGKTQLGLKAWHHVAMVRDGGKVAIYLDGKKEAEGEAELTDKTTSGFLGGRSDGFSGWEGKLDEFAIFPRALDEKEILQLATWGKSAQ